MQKLFENWRRYKQQVLKEVKDEDWHHAPDVDMPYKTWKNTGPSKKLVVFRAEDIYDLTNDMNHGGVSHAIKHLHELDLDYLTAQTEAAAHHIIDQVSDKYVFIKSKKRVGSLSLMFSRAQQRKKS